MSTKTTQPAIKSMINSLTQKAVAAQIRNQNGQRPKRRQNRNRRSGRPRIPGVAFSRAPIGYGFSQTTQARIYTSRNGNTRVEFREIFPIKKEFSSPICFMLPMCPTKWTGTRACILCSTYTDQRPIHVKIEWQPAVPTSTAGTFTVGTVFSGARLTDSTDYEAVSRQLTSSNGGFMTTVWKPAWMNVALSRNLRANNFPMYNVDPDDIPFWIIAASSIPESEYLGNLVITATLSLKNPINPNSVPPVNGFGPATFEQTTDEQTQKKTTRLKVPKDTIKSALSSGADYIFNFSRAILNDVQETIVDAVGGLLGTYEGVEQGNHSFIVDNRIASQDNLLFTLIGRALNF